MNGKITKNIFGKADHLHLYLPATSYHPFHLLEGLIHGMVCRTISLSCSKEDQAVELQNLVRRLTAQGYQQQSLLADIISTTYHQIQQKYKLRTNTQKEDDPKPDTGSYLDEVFSFIHFKFLVTLHPPSFSNSFKKP